MKPFLSIDLTENKNNTQPNNSEFLAAQPSEALLQAHSLSLQQAEDTLKASKLPMGLRILQNVCGCIGLVMFFALLRALGQVSLAKAYENAPWLPWIAGSLILVWAILTIASVVRSKSVLETDESIQKLEHLKQANEAIFTELGVPANATTVDILVFYYKIKNGKLKVTEKGMQMTPYLNPIFHVFADEENLYLADLTGKYAFPRSSLVAIHTVKKQTGIAGWNKPVAHNKGIYKQYKIGCNQYGNIFCKCHHILEVNHNGTPFGIYIPDYELPVFESLTGLKAES